MITKEQLKLELKEELINFFNSDLKIIDFDQVSFGLLREVLEELDYIQDPSGDFDTNGWQYDFWVDYIKDNNGLEISGSLWYGDISITKLKNL